MMANEDTIARLRADLSQTQQTLTEERQSYEAQQAEALETRRRTEQNLALIKHLDSQCRQYEKDIEGLKKLLEEQGSGKEGKARSSRQKREPLAVVDLNKDSGQRARGTTKRQAKQPMRYTTTVASM